MSADRARLMTLPLRYIEARHRLGLIDGAMEDRLLAARRAFAQSLPAALRDAVEFYDFGKYNSSATLLDNILFGRVVYGQAQAEARIRAILTEVMDELNLRDSVIEVVYVSALNCSFCRGWELSNLSDGRGFRATPDWREVSFTRLRKGAAGAMLSPSFFPERLRPVAECRDDAERGPERRALVDQRHADPHARPPVRCLPRRHDAIEAPARILGGAHRCLLSHVRAASAHPC